MSLLSCGKDRLPIAVIGGGATGSVTGLMLAALGFKALATTSAGFAWSQGVQDSNVTREQLMGHCRELSAASDLPPPIADGHTGARGAQRLWTHTGMPAITVPVTRAGALPVGVQLIGRRGADALVFAAARRLERG